MADLMGVPHGVPHVLDAVTLATDDFAAMVGVYEAALLALGLERVAELVDEEEDDAVVEAAGWGADGVASLWLVTGAIPTRGAHVRLRARSRDSVERFFAAAVTAGAIAHSAPRRWTPYRRGEFSATVRDAAGNLLEAVSAE